MSIDLSQFISTFLEESYEGLEVMESSLLNLDSADEETINAIFRAAHSIKGGAGTFGFNDVAEFTHVVETLLDEMRSGQQDVTPDLVNLLLESVDCIKSLLEAAQDGPEADNAMIKSVHDRLQQALGAEVSESPALQTELNPATEVETQVSSEKSVWLIKFSPNPDLLQAGHEPALMFESLSDLGPVSVFANAEDIPKFAKLNPEEVFLSWVLVLDADCDESEVAEVFEWVEGECDLSIERVAESALVSMGISSGVAGDTDGSARYYDIAFKPYETMIQTGNEPSFMFESLAEFGDLSVVPDITSLPDFSDFDPEKIFISWQLKLESDCEQTDVEEIFEWVEDECDLSITLVEPSSSSTMTLEVELTDTEVKQLDAVSQSATNEAESTANKTDSVSNSAETPATATTSIAKPASKPAAAAKKAKPAAETSSIRVDTDKIDALINRVGELVITQAMLGQVGEELAEITAGSEVERLQSGLDQLERNTRDLQEDVMRVRMLPISFVFNRFPRLVHDVSGKLGKKVELVITGEQTEIDKTVMEKIGDPMVHLIRNSLDHGLESPEERLAAGKSEVGKVQLDAYHQGGYIIIDIIDDGRGLNTQKIYDKALEKGLITADQQLSDAEINELIFKAGFSTADAVSDLSGRGVGMDVVRRNIESLGGHVSVKSEPGYGSTFSVSLPLTLAILDGQLIRVKNETYIIPLISIVETILAGKDAMSSIAGEDRLLHFRDEYIPLINLRSLFKLPVDEYPADTSLIAIVENGGQKVGLVVDELYGQQQVVIKSLEVNFKRIEGFAGATILGNGNVALILDIAGLMKRGLDHETAVAAKKRNEIFNNESDQGIVA